MNTEELIYHYCANEKMISILESKTMRLSDIVKSNDFNELQLFYPDIFFEIEKAYINAPWVFDYKEKTGIEAFQLLLTDVDSLIKEEIRTGAITSFVTCFSGARDRLSQWRGYADDGRGGAIAFSTNDLKLLTKSTKELRFVKVSYVTHEELKNIITKQAESLIKKWIKKWNQVNKFVFKHQNMTIELKELLFCILCYEDINEAMIDSLEYKSIDFEEENEYRLYTTSGNIKFSDEDILKSFENTFLSSHLKKNIVAEKLRFRVTTDNIVPYYPISLNEISDNPIKELLLGPRNRIIMSDLYLFLNNCGWQSRKIKIGHSNISYRA